MISHYKYIIYNIIAVVRERALIAIGEFEKSAAGTEQGTSQLGLHLHGVRPGRNR